jgi:glycosyltransferase involved in cell wall biosynthesis
MVRRPPDAGSSPEITLRGAPELSIVMPCLDEERTLGTCVAKALEFLRSAGVEGEVVVADNGSRDRSVEIARAAGARVISVPERGYGSALRDGIEAARGRYVIVGDSDDTYDFRALQPFVEKLRSGCDVVIGNRYRGGIEPGAMPFLHRFLGNPALTAAARICFGARVGDVYCGLRGLRKSALERMNLQSDGMEFALEMVVKSSLLGMRIEEVPVTLTKSARGRPSHLLTWRDGRRSLRLYLMYAPRWVFLYPGLLLVAAGAIGFGLIEGRVSRVGRVQFDVHTMLYCGAAVLIGFQAMFFSLFSRIVATRVGFLPENPWLERRLERFRVEYGVVLALLLVSGGVWGSLAAVDEWRRAAFGDLDPFKMLRVVIPSVISLTLGIQIAFASLYLGLLKHYHEPERRRRGRAD